MYINFKLLKENCCDYPIWSVIFLTDVSDVLSCGSFPLHLIVMLPLDASTVLKETHNQDSTQSVRPSLTESDSQCRPFLG